MIQIDEVGTLYNPGTYDSEGEELTAPEPLEGWHVNASHEVAEWAAYKVTPTTPRRVFGGAPTVFYTFPDAEMVAELLESSDLTVPTVIEVPHMVTMRQARLALLDAGLLGNVASAIATLPSPPKEAVAIEWEYSQTIERDRPFTGMLGQALGLDAAALDALFIAADKL